MPDYNQGISDIPEILSHYGIHNAVISPGSRNAPLVMAFTTHPGMMCESIVDERSAGFVALGISKSIEKPVVLVCTSGSAVLNYSPSLSEAYYSRVPLIVLTADRPPEWIDQNDGQTIRQNDIFRNFIKKSYTLPVSTEKQAELYHYRQIISAAYIHSVSGVPGPVHINVPLREPLYGQLPPADSGYKPVKNISKVNPSVSLPSFEEAWKKYNRKMIITGSAEMYEPLPEDILTDIASHKQAVVIAENLSRINGENIISSPERLIPYISNKPAMAPELLITMGGPVLSKKLKQYIRQNKPIEHWHIANNPDIIDTFQSVTHKVLLQPGTFFQSMGRSANMHNTDYVDHFLKYYDQSLAMHENFFTNIDFCDFTAYKVIFDLLPENADLHLANSTPVRYAHLFEPHPGTRYFSNRGVSGIDGCVSTTVGFARFSKRKQILLCGDLAFIYDSNGLWNTQLPPNLVIIVFDNGGGNIFSIIETGKQHESFRAYQQTPHNVKIEEICRTFDVDYLHASDQHSLTKSLHLAFKPNKRAVVIHITSNGDLSATMYKQYFKNLTDHE